MPVQDQLRSCTVGVLGPCLMARVAALVIPMALAAAACAAGASGPPPPGTAPPPSSASVTPGVPTSSVSVTPTPAATAPSIPPHAGSSEIAPAPPTALEPSPTAPPVAIDGSLADLLPATVDGLPVERAAETESAALTSPTLGADADGFAAVQVATPDLADLAVASIVRLKSTTNADAFYAEWRPSFDEAVCGPAGGVSSREVRTIAGRSVDTTLCVEGARVYHVRTDGGRILLSVLDVGTRGFGEGLLEGLGD